MVNRVKKGYRIEKRAREELERDGYQILFKSTRTRFGCQDYANLFDVCVAKGHERRNISVKSFVSNSRHSEHKKDIEEFANKCGLDGESFELWLWHEREDWEKISWEGVTS